MPSEVFFVFEKIVISLLKGLSAVIYVAIMITLFSIPVVFIYQAVKPPVFTLDSMTIEEVSEDDTYPDTLGEYKDGIIKLNFNMIADSGKFSPYTYEISEFAMEENEYTKILGEIPVFLDEPLSFSNKVSDSCTLSIYVEKDKIDDLEKLAESITFTATKFEKSFAEFSVKHGEDKNGEETTDSADTTTDEATTETSADTTTDTTDESATNLSDEASTDTADSTTDEATTETSTDNTDESTTNLSDKASIDTAESTTAA